MMLAGAILAALALLASTAPRAPAAYDAPVPAEERARNAALLAALASGGIERAWVDAGEARVLVVYEPPPALAVDVAQRYALGAAAVVAPDAEELVARTTTGIEWRVACERVLAYQAGSISLAELGSSVTSGAWDPR